MECPRVFWRRSTCCSEAARAPLILPRFLVSALAGLLLAAPAVHAAEPSGVAIIVARGTPSPIWIATNWPLSTSARSASGQTADASPSQPASQSGRAGLSVAILGHTPEELDEYWRD
jgi:hypothetical protein